MGGGREIIAGSERRLASELAALGHPIRLQLFAAFVDGAQSPVEAVRTGSGGTLEKAAYHVGVLHKAGLLARTGERRKRGAVEHLYKPTGRGLELFHAVLKHG